MEIRIVLFLAFVSVTLITNTLVLLFAYKAFAGLTSKLTRTVSDFGKSSEARKWIDSMHVAAERAVTITESTKIKIAEFDPVLIRTQEKHALILADADARLEKTASDIDGAALTIRNAVAKPAFAVVSFTAGVRKALDER
jgi:hypothetical protein